MVSKHAAMKIDRPSILVLLASMFLALVAGIGTAGASARAVSHRSSRVASALAVAMLVASACTTSGSGTLSVDRRAEPSTTPATGSVTPVHSGFRDHHHGRRELAVRGRR